ncbi:MAG: HD domain-containing protein [Chitinispirillia bacterium]|nr:HD domain-containing protein [Chitinispirillia bacterium]
MKLLKNEKVIDIMERTLNHVDNRLIDHGIRVAYLMFKVLERQNRFNETQLRDICILGMLHDVGAYKTEEVDRMVVFETVDVWNHSIYGYLFLKHFSPLRDLAPAILFHHADCEELKYIDDISGAAAPDHKFIAQLISLCDRADVFELHKGMAEVFRKHVNAQRGVTYLDDIADMFLGSGVDIDTVFDGIGSDTEFNRIFRTTPMGKEEADQYLKMIVSAMDFRSYYTVIHTASAVCVADSLAGLLGISESGREQIKTGAILHDIGKTGVPVEILESTGRLSDTEMNIIKTHVDITRQILAGSVDDVVMGIAVNHHEKLNGKGYQKQLSGADITQYERIMAVADIFSALCESRSYKAAYPKDKVCGILHEMSDERLIDSEIVSLAISNYDDIFESLTKKSAPIKKIYETMGEEYSRIIDKVEKKISSDRNL